MMDPALAALLGVAIGGVFGIAGGVVLEAYKRRRDRQGTASALAGEIASILFLADRRGYVAFFEGILPRLGAGENVPIGNFAPSADQPDPVAKAFIDRLGLLPGQLPERVVRFYSMTTGIRRDLERMAKGEFDVAGKIFIIKQDLEIWREAVLLGNELVAELRQVR
jgi:hypothetical protein